MIALLAVAAMTTAGRPAEGAQYVLRGHPDITADFRSVESGSGSPSTG